jgi:phosphoribosylaminoimidazole-succinocarboxamide synthase
MALYESTIKSLPRLGKGKVRDIYAVGNDKMLIVTSDRLSAFDVVLTDPIPDKGRVLNEMANFWFSKLGHVVPNQLTGVDPESVVSPSEKSQVQGRAVVVKKLKPLPIEAVVRGYIIGSGWKDYQKTGKVCGIELPKGLQQAQKLPEPIFTPATKAETGHDEDISFEGRRS